MRIRTKLQAAALIALAVVVGLLGVGGTWALWNAAAGSNAGTVQSAGFDISLNGAPMGATAVAVTETDGAVLKPGVPVYATVTVHNATEAGTPMSVKADLAAPKVVNPSVPALATAMTVRAAPGPAKGGCAQATYPSANTAATTVVAQGGTARFCLRMSLPAAVPMELANATATISTTITVTQQPAGN